MAANIYDRIKQIATEKNMSIRHLEEAAGVSFGSICKWNDVSPSVVTLKKVADELGVSLDDILQIGR